MTTTIEKMKRKLAEWEVEKERSDMERGFCMVDLPKLPSSFTTELLNRAVADARPFLTRYVRMMKETGDWVRIEDCTKLNEWKLAFDIVHHYDPSEVIGDSISIAIRYSEALGRIAGAQTEDPSFWMEWIYKTLKKDIPHSNYEGSPEEFDAVSEKAKGELLKWLEININTD